MRLLAFSDIHRDAHQARELVARAPDVDVVVAAGDLASVHRGLELVRQGPSEHEASRPFCGDRDPSFSAWAQLGSNQ